MLFIGNRFHHTASSVPLIMRLINYFLTLDNNFWTRNLSKSFEVSKELDFSLVSNNNLSKIPQSSTMLRNRCTARQCLVYHRITSSENMRIRVG